MSLLINTQNRRMPLQQRIYGWKKEECLPNNSHAFLQACVLMVMSAWESHTLVHCSHIPGQRMIFIKKTEIDLGMKKLLEGPA